jgi:hypothetical protein
VRQFVAVLLDWERMDRDEHWDAVENLRAGMQVVETGRVHIFRLEALTVGHVFEQLNIDHPEGYRFRSLSVGDFVVDVEKRLAVRVARMGYDSLPKVDVATLLAVARSE